MVSLPRNSWSGLSERPGQISAEHIATLPRNTWSISAVYPPKPFDQNRLFAALTRFVSPAVRSDGSIKYLAVKSSGQVRLIDITEVIFVKGAGIYTELHLNNGKQELHDKSLDLLEQLFPDRFERIHKSNLADLQLAEKIIVNPGSRYSLVLKTGHILPVGRSRYKMLRDKSI